MTESIIGLHIYSISQHRTRKPKKIRFSTAGDGARLKSFCPHFISRHATETGEEGQARAWFLEPADEDGHSFHGLVRYGSSGYASDLVDRSTRAVNYKRKTSDIEIIPLYYRLWVPDKGKFALLALQTYGQRSCVRRFQQALESGFREANEGFRITFRPVVPTSLASIQNADVKSVSLIKRDYSSDSAENQLVPADDLVDLSISFKAKKKENLGLFRSLSQKIKSTDGQSVLKYNDTTFDEASAIVQVGRRRRKVTLIGLDQDTGKFDLTDDVRRGPNGHPKFNSISREVEAIFEDIVTGGQS